jgi:hypothetical protein
MHELDLDMQEPIPKVKCSAFHGVVRTKSKLLKSLDVNESKSLY